ncbi:shikimate kinase [Leptolyngbya sp. FACHB-261]|uniref:shikimate kinase n=1 Tax=Leptolyngbya sp. FACHB-261 TaxID=2692806 RepID=UPI0028C4F4AB|nr:shikimate kinase [Leptolyngbya sp. FACHB-261]
MNLFLVGMMGAGKSTVGRELAQRMSYRFLDTDALVEQISGRSVQQIFAESGEASFRQLEQQVLSELATYTRLVVATGGGIVQDASNWSYLHHGIVVWLDVAIEELLSRLRHDPTPRPLLLESPDPAAVLQRLLDQRQDRYRQADLHITVLAGESPATIAQRILEQLPTILKQ